MLELTSSANPKIKEARRLWKRSERDKTQLFLIEGFREISRALASTNFVRLFTCESLFLGSSEHKIISALKIRGVEIYPCNEQVFRKLSYRDRPDGLLALAHQKHLGLEQLEVENNPLIVVAEAIEKPGNLGTILRSCDAAGASALIVCDRCTDIHNPNVVRASVGTLFTLPVIEASSQETLEWLSQREIEVVAATPSASLEYTQVDLKKGIAIAVGTEQYGLSKVWMESAKLQVKIPMHGEADSLNVSIATSLLLYEAVRQRR